MKHSPSPDVCGDCEGLRTRECLSTERVPLSTYKPGEKGTIVQLCGPPDFRLRLMEMGFVKGTEVRVVKDAPLTDPVEFAIKGYHITLRRDEAAEILMDPPSNGNGRKARHRGRKGHGHDSPKDP